MSLSNPEFSHSRILRPIVLGAKSRHPKGSLPGLTLTALGVVFGDIGTSPLYALKACFDPVHGVPFSPETVKGVISLVFWAFIMVVSIKYVLFVMRANNHGEGGILALMALALRTARPNSRRGMGILMLGVFGACMFYGDAVITPAISVMSAVEGLTLVSPELEHFVMPVTVIILIVLFVVQKHGTGFVGSLFGPIMALWFLSLAALGFYHISDYPAILLAVNPLYGLEFLFTHQLQAFIVLGAVFLVLTGAEALYADMGHFGMKPIRYAWFMCAMPCLLINYFGQGAMVIANPAAITNPFFLMVPQSFTLVIVILATMATVIASQAVISGAYSMTSQAIMLGFVPRMKIIYTSEREIGQIYIPTVNWLLLVSVILVVLGFGHSSNLAAAYGIAVTTTMVITTILAAVVMRAVWQWNPFLVAVIIITFLFIDMAFFAANFIKIFEGGWFPLLLGLICFTLLMTWYNGRMVLRKRATERGIPLMSFVQSLVEKPPHRVQGSAVFLTAHVDFVPVAMLHNLKHNQVLHNRVIFLKISIWDVPYVNDDDRISLKAMGGGFYLVRAIYGFKETPDVFHIMETLSTQHKIVCNLMETSFFLDRDTIVAHQAPELAMWRQRLFIWMYRMAARPSDFFKIPMNRVIEMGAKIEF